MCRCAASVSVSRNRSATKLLRDSLGPDRLGVRIDEIDRPQIPSGVGHAEPYQMPVAGRDLEPLPLEADRAVTAPLPAIDRSAEDAAQLLTAPARPADVRA